MRIREDKERNRIRMRSLLQRKKRRKWQRKKKKERREEEKRKEERREKAFGLEIRSNDQTRKSGNRQEKQVSGSCSSSSSSCLFLGLNFEAKVEFCDSYIISFDLELFMLVPRMLNMFLSCMSDVI